MAAVGLAAAAPVLAGDDLPEGAQEMRSAVVAVGDGPEFPAVPAPVQAVTLPDDWSASRPGFQGTVWYRVQVEFDPLAGERRAEGAAAGSGGARRGPAGELLALHIARVCSSYEVHLNGQIVASGGRMREPVSHQCSRPQLVTLPPALLVAGRNELDIKVVGHRLAEVGSAQRAGGLSELVVGPLAALAPYHGRQTALAVGFAQGASATLLLMGGFMFVLGYVNRRQSQLAYFGALCVGLAVFDSRLWLRDLPVSHRVAEFLLLVLLAFITWAAVQFLLRSRGMRLKQADSGLPVQCAVVAVSLLAAGPERLHMLAVVWYWVFAVEIGAAGVLLLRHRGSAEMRLPAALLAAGVALAVLAGALGAGNAAQFPAGLAGVALPLVVLFVGLRLVMQHGRARREAEASRAQLEQGKAQLEQRVREATQEIERNMRQIADHKVEQVAEKERKRIAADLHDDLGAKLLTIVHTSESDRISTLAREALEEMRLSVRGLTGRPVRLADAMGDWRAETVARLGQAGIEGEWHGPDEAPQMLSSRAYVQTTRILREATSNIIKHSGASRCSVSCVTADGDFQLVIQDNGDGISQDVDARLDRGHGLASMKNRAKQLQGQCLVESGPGYGTVIRLTLPLDRATGTS
ncbi:MAG: sensor histidine kinase [Rubrivivax sp.]|nr:sensor histidine kinase [Rubrivivax sp.]